VALTQEGIINRVRARKNIDAALDAKAFGGGIRGAGSNLLGAELAMAEGLATGWSPHPNDPVEDGWIEVHLGRVVAAHRIKLAFAEEAPPFEVSGLLLSTGEPALDSTLVPVPGPPVL